MLLIALKGFFLSAGLIVAIGPQNAFVLRQGLKKHHVFACAMLASLYDATLILFGISGFGLVLDRFPALITIVLWAGVAFLTVYGARSFLRALRPDVLEVNNTVTPDSLIKTLAILSGLTLLNPHVYLDTIFLQGSIAASFQGIERAAFGLGAMSASFVWFFGLGYGARLLRPLFTKAKAWQILDIIIGCVMWAIAAGLVVDGLSH